MSTENEQAISIDWIRVPVPSGERTASVAWHVSDELFDLLVDALPFTNVRTLTGARGPFRCADADLGVPVMLYGREREAPTAATVAVDVP